METLDTRAGRYRVSFCETSGQPQYAGLVLEKMFWAMT